MPAHEEVLRVALRICTERGEWTFTPDEIVRALPHLNPGTVRTHVTSRCCVNAPKNHPHKWDYFRRIGRGRYQVAPKYRGRGETGHSTARERRAAYAAGDERPTRDTIHAVMTHSTDWYSAECLELAVITQGRTLDETVSNLRDAIALHLEGEDRAALGLSNRLTLRVSYEGPLQR